VAQLSLLPTTEPQPASLGDVAYFQRWKAVPFSATRHDNLRTLPAQEESPYLAGGALSEALTLGPGGPQPALSRKDRSHDES
jgi:hypothetical protein